jgi:hypothetical protein
MKRIILLAILGAGCSTTLVGKAQDENPFYKPDHIGEGIDIPTKDAQIISNAGESVGDPGKENRGRYAASGASYTHPTFHQTCYFQAPNPNQIIFLVELQNRWRELTHAESYEVSMTDDRGRKFLPADVKSTSSHVVWAGMVLGRTDVIHMTVLSSSFNGGYRNFSHGEGTTGDPTDNTTMLAARSLIEFRGPNIVTPTTKRIVLQLRNRNRSLEFVWDFKK